jgi:hypothetical protein
MWCPALAAGTTRLYFQHNLRGFGTSTVLQQMLIFFLLAL